MTRNRMNASDTALESPKSIFFNFNITEVVDLNYSSEIILYNFVMSYYLANTCPFIITSRRERPMAADLPNFNVKTFSHYVGKVASRSRDVYCF